MKPSSAGQVVVIGSSNTDMIVRVPRLPGPGETLLGGKFQTAAGGKGANQAVAAARAGGRVTWIGAVGRDALGDAAVAGLEREGIDVSRVVRAPGTPSGVALIFVGESGENAIAVAGGANDRLTPAHVARAKALFDPQTVVLLQLETPLTTVARAIALARRAGARVILNPAPAARLPDALLAQVDVLTPNEHEARLLTGISTANESGARKAARALRARGVATVIVTLGAHGALLADAGGERVIPGFRVRAVDTTAAGDVFNGALAARLADGTGLDEAIRFAHAAAALSVTQMGAQPSIPRRRAVLTFLRNPQTDTR